MARPTHDIVATVGEYTRKDTGEKKKRYLNCGKAFTDDQGRISLKMDALPLGPAWSGWLSLYPIEGQDAPTPQQAPDPRRQASPPAQNHDAEEGADDDIPF